MTHLIKLELKKFHIRNYILIVILSILASMFFVSVALHDSSGKTYTFENTFRVIEMIFAFVFVILFSVLNSTLILSEYNHKTILIMFTYPVDRRKLILSKLILITLFIAVSLFAGYVLCGSFIISMHHWFHWIEEDFQISVLQNWLLRAVSTTIVFCNLGLWTFVVGMWKKSVPMAIVSSVLFINLRQIVVASAETCRENIWFVFMAILITVITIWYTLMHKIENLD